MHKKSKRLLLDFIPVNCFFYYSDKNWLAVYIYILILLVCIFIYIFVNCIIQIVVSYYN